MPGALLAGILLLVLSKIPNFLTRISNREIFLNSIFVFRHPLQHALRAPQSTAEEQLESWTPGNAF